MGLLGVIRDEGRKDLLGVDESERVFADRVLRVIACLFEVLSTRVKERHSMAKL